MTCAYVCPGTAAAPDSAESARLAHESTLRDELFEDGEGVKVRCAKCLLDSVPNGCAVVCGTPAELAAVARQATRGRDAASEPLHHDHAHAVAHVPAALLTQLARLGTRTARADQHARLAACLAEQGLEPSDPDAAGSTPEQPTVVLGHHIDTVAGRQLFGAAAIPVDASLLVLLYGNGAGWDLDLPGGKRHLGEGTWACTVRESREESSLQLTADRRLCVPGEPDEPSLVFRVVADASIEGMRYHLLATHPESAAAAAADADAAADEDVDGALSAALAGALALDEGARSPPAPPDLS